MGLPLILDCTFRDGGYMNDWRFPDRMVRDVYRADSKAGVDYVEIGFHGTQEFFDPARYGTWRFSPERDVRSVTDGISGSRLALMVDHGKFRVEDIPDKRESAIDLYRIAVHRDGIREAAEQATAIKLKGYEISLNLMGIATYSQSERNELSSILAEVPLDYAYIGDTYGSILPDDIPGLVDLMRSLGEFKIGFHPHNNLQMAFANTLEAIRCGIDIVDGSLFGIGRGAGNLPLETFVSYLQTKEPERYNALPLMNMVDRYLIAMQQETPWGYRLPYMLSGMFNVHPNYALQMLDSNEYSVEDIWKTLQMVRQMDPVGFDPNVLPKLVNDGFVGATVLPEQPIVSDDEEEGAASAAGQLPPVSYANVHQGRDFLVLANGPTLQTHAAEIKEFIDLYDPIVLGANYLGGLFVPHYHAFNNKRRFESYADQVSPRSKLLLGNNFDDAFIREYTSSDFDWLVFRNRFADFGIDEHGVIGANCRTISVLLCGVALVMGARRVFAAGMDGYVGLNTSGKVHFYDEADETSNRDIELRKHQLCRWYLEQIAEYAEANNSGLTILTPTSYASFYSGIQGYLARARSADIR